jgi:hypothetical protein
MIRREHQHRPEQERDAMSAIDDESEAVPDGIRTEAAAVLAARRRVIEQHREDWRQMRELVLGAVRDAETMTGLERDRTMRAASVAMEIVHAGEKRAWGLRKPRRKLSRSTDRNSTRSSPICAPRAAGARRSAPTARR